MIPFFSIILPTFNRANVITRSISSVINQSYKNWELIIIDNISNDKTSEIIKNFNDDRIKYYKFLNNGIIAKSRNFGISKSLGEFIAFLDSDDWWKKDKLKDCLYCIERGNKFIYHNAFINKNYFFYSKKLKFFRKINSSVYADLINNGPAFAMSSVIIQKKLFSEISFFKENKLSNWDDFDAWLRLSKIHDNFYCLDKPLVNIGIDKNNGLTPQVQIDMIEDIKKSYFYNDNLPNWCLYALVIAFLRLRKYEKAKLIMKKIKISKLPLIHIIKIVFLYFFLMIKK